MRAGIAFVSLFLVAGIALAEEGGGGTVVEQDKEEPKAAGNPNAADPGLENDGWKSYDMTYVPFLKDFPVKTFTGGPRAVSSGDDGQVLDLPVKDKDGVSVRSEEFAISIDADGSGDFEQRIKTDGDGCVLTLVYEDGTKAPYAVSFFKGRKWSYKRSGYWTGTINKTPIGLVDNNTNGSYDENGQDAISVGLTGYATPLSSIVNLGGTLYNIKIAKTGMKVWVKEWVGESGKLDGVSGHKSLGRLASAIFRNGDMYFDVVASKEKACVVPVGTWEFFAGESKAGSGSMSAMMRKGSMEDVEVKTGETTKVGWGVNLRIEFDFEVNGSQVTILADAVHVYGAANEEYYNFVPPAFTPVVTVWDLSTGEQSQKGKMSLC